MDWNTSIRIKDDGNLEHMLEVATSFPFPTGKQAVDIFINEIDDNGKTIKSWNMQYDLVNKIIVYPLPTEFNKNIIKEMEIIINTGAEHW